MNSNSRNPLLLIRHFTATHPFFYPDKACKPVSKKRVTRCFYAFFGRFLESGAKFLGFGTKFLESGTSVTFFKANFAAALHACSRNHLLLLHRREMSYRLEVTTQFSGSGGVTLKEPRTAVFDCPLTVQ